MAYDKQTWQTGDVVTSAKLNHMEDGIASAGSAFYVSITTEDGETYQSSKTYAEILAAYQAGQVIIIVDEVEYYGTAVAHSFDTGIFSTFVARGFMWTTSESNTHLDVFSVEIGPGMEQGTTNVVYRSSGGNLS